MASTQTQGGRRDIRKAMLAAGVAQIEASGVDAPASLNTALALADADVKRGSTFGKNRIWAQQWHYQVDVLKEIVEKFPSSELLHTFDELADAVLSKDLATPAGRSEGLGLLVNHPATFSGLIKGANEWLLWNAIWSCVISTPTEDDDEELGAPARQGYELVGETIEKRYGSILGWLGFKPKSPTADAVLAGIVLDLILGAASTPATAKPNDMAAAVEALVNAFYTAERPMSETN